MTSLNALALAACLLCAGAAHAAPPVDAATRTQVIDALARQLNDYYVYPDVAARMDQAVHAKAAHGDYDRFDDARAFAGALTADLVDISHDKHLRVMTGDTPAPPMPTGEPTAAQLDNARTMMAARGYGVGKVEILKGAVGYLDLRGFDRLQFSRDAIAAAMTQLSSTDALIVDMRHNGGGDPATVAFLCSYLFDGRVHLNDLHWRKDDRTEAFWTDPNVPGKHYGQQKPVYVLTGPRTFSGGEEFSYDLQQLKRATLVGETTGGGANPGRVRILTPYFGAFIPNGRAVNPVTQTSWEGTGVVPEIKVAADDALATALEMALYRLRPPVPL